MRKSNLLFVLITCLVFALCFTACNTEPKHDSEDGTVTIYIKAPTRALMLTKAAAPEGTPKTVTVKGGVIDRDFLARNGIDPESVRGLVFDGKIVEIQDGAFSSCTNLKEVEIPETVKTLSEVAFPATTVVYSKTEEIAGHYYEDVHYPVTVTVKNVYGTNPLRTTEEAGRISYIETYNDIEIEEAIITACAVEIEGYDAEDPVYSVSFEEPVLAKKNMEITITWAPNTYNVHFIWNNLERAFINDVEYDALTDVPDIGYDREGYCIGGWRLGAEGDCVPDSENPEQNMIEEFINLTATDGEEIYLYLAEKTNDAEYTINYDLNGGSSLSFEKSVKQAYNEFVVVPEMPEDIVPPTGMHFIGWAKSKTSEEPDYVPGSLKKPYNLCTGIDGDVETTLYAVWELNEYTIMIYEGNSWRYTAVGDYAYGDNLSLLIDVCKGWYSDPKSGYKFVGLSETKPEDSATTIKVDYSENAPVLNTKKTDKVLKLYIVVAPKVYTITFDKNADDAVGEVMAPQTMTYGTEKALTKNTYSRDHYASGEKFGGWYTDWNYFKGEPEKIYKDEQVVTKIDGYLNATLKAYWIPDNYTITFDVNNEKADSSFTMEDQPFTYEKSNRDKLFVNEFRVKTVTGDGGVGHNAQVFVGWSLVESPEEGDPIFEDASDAKEVIAAEIDRLAALEEPQHLDDEATITLYAKWKDAYTVVLKIAGGDVGQGSPDVELATFEAPFGEDVALPAYSTYEDEFENTGYKIVGWTDKKKVGSKVSDDNLLTCAEADVTNNQYVVYANVVPITYNVKLLTANGKALISEITEIPYGTSLTAEQLMLGEQGQVRGVRWSSVLSYISVPRDYYGYHVAGWSTEKNGSGTVYNAENLPKNLTVTDDDTVYLYVINEPNQYKVNVKTNDATTGDGYTIEYSGVFDGELNCKNEPIEKHSKEAQTVAPFDYQLLGFGLSKEDTKVEFPVSKNGKIVLDKDVLLANGLYDDEEITLYAKWAAKVDFEGPTGYEWKTRLMSVWYDGDAPAQYLPIGTVIEWQAEKASTLLGHSYVKFEIRNDDFYFAKKGKEYLTVDFESGSIITGPKTIIVSNPK